MNTNTKQNNLKERFQKLPPDVQDAIFSTETANIIMKTGKENDLNIEQIGILGEETGNLMMGFTPPNEFVSTLAEKLKIDKTKAKIIAEALNKEVFSKIRESLKRIHSRQEREAAEAEEKREEKRNKEEPRAEKEPPTIMPQTIKPQSYTEEIPQEKASSQEQKKEDELIRSRAEIIEKKHPEETAEKPTKPPLSSYPEGKDPYREPID